MGRLDGKVALVTGGAQGIGSGIVRRFVAEGARVAICDIAEEPGHALAAELGAKTRFIRLDVASMVEWLAVVAETERQFGPLNILVNNAGRGSRAFVESVSEQQFTEDIAINQTGVLLGMQAAIPSPRRGGRGSIINISSLQGIEADVGLTSYVAAKFAVRGITKSAAMELGREGIRANSIHPGLTRATGTAALPDEIFGTIPLRRKNVKDKAGYPVDVGNLAVFLASEEASYITGAEFVIDGGKSVRFATHGAAPSAFAAGG